jgi:hypothetical protein
VPRFQPILCSRRSLIAFAPSERLRREHVFDSMGASSELTPSDIRYQIVVLHAIVVDDVTNSPTSPSRLISIEDRD